MNGPQPQTASRRQFLTVATSLAAASWMGSSAVSRCAAEQASTAARADAADKADQVHSLTSALQDQVGITTSSLSGHLAAKPGAGQFSLEQLPAILRDELGMTVIDLNTSSLASLEAGYLDRCRNAAEKAGCRFTNLKLNQRNLDMNSTDEVVRTQALNAYERSIDAAAILGCRWARVLPSASKPDMTIHIAAQMHLATYCAKRNMQLLIENYGWMDSDPESLPRLVKAIGDNVAACPDTGNWSSDAVRYAGLAAAFPLAITCDFKASKLGPHGEHNAYDLKRCFTIGWEAGFRGPWCLEHANPDRKSLFRELTMLRDMVQTWTKEAAGPGKPSKG